MTGIGELWHQLPDGREELLGRVETENWHSALQALARPLRELPMGSRLRLAESEGIAPTGVRSRIRFVWRSEEGVTLVYYVQRTPLFRPVAVGEDLP